MVELSRNSRLRLGLVAILISAAFAVAPMWAQQSSAETTQDPETGEATAETTDDEPSDSAEGDDEASEKEKEKEKDISDDPTVTRISSQGRSVERGETKSNQSPLVKAANASGTKKSSKSFTDADLSKTKGRLIIVEGTNVREPEVPSIEEQLREKKRREQKEAGEAQQRKAGQYQRDLQTQRVRDEIKKLEAELRRLENEFYVTEDDIRREEVQQQYESTKEALENARESLKESQSGGGNG